MTMTDIRKRVVGPVDPAYSADARAEMRLLGLLDDQDRVLAFERVPPQVPRQAVSNENVLNEAYAYELPSSFTRGLTMEMKAGQRVVWLSGTASIDNHGVTVYPGDFHAQLWRTYRNLAELLEASGATWHDVVRTSCYLRDIERDYDEFNKIRTLFFSCLGLDPLPASTGIQARLCRSDLLIEIELFAILADGK